MGTIGNDMFHRKTREVLSQMDVSSQMTLSDLSYTASQLQLASPALVNGSATAAPFASSELAAVTEVTQKAAAYVAGTRRDLREWERIRSIVAYVFVAFPVLGLVLMVVASASADPHVARLALALVWLGALANWGLFGLHVPLQRVARDVCGDASQSKQAQDARIYSPATGLRVHVVTCADPLYANLVTMQALQCTEAAVALLNNEGAAIPSSLRPAVLTGSRSEIEAEVARQLTLIEALRLAGKITTRSALDWAAAGLRAVDFSQKAARCRGLDLVVSEVEGACKKWKTGAVLLLVGNGVLGCLLFLWFIPGALLAVARRVQPPVSPRLNTHSTLYESKDKEAAPPGQWTQLPPVLAPARLQELPEDQASVASFHSFRSGGSASSRSGRSSYSSSYSSSSSTDAGGNRRRRVRRHKKHKKVKK